MNRISSILVLALMSLLVSCKVPESMAWVVSTFAGSTEGFANGIGNTAQFNNPVGVTVDSSGNVYVADAIRKITPADRIEDRVVSTFAGSGTANSGNGTANTAQFNFPTGVAVDSSGNFYVADANNHRIRKITPGGVVNTIAGTDTPGFADGTGNTAEFNYPTGVAVDSFGNFYVTDYSNHRIRKIEYKVPWAATRWLLMSMWYLLELPRTKAGADYRFESRR